MRYGSMSYRRSLAETFRCRGDDDFNVKCLTHSETGPSVTAPRRDRATAYAESF